MRHRRQLPPPRAAPSRRWTRPSSRSPSCRSGCGASSGSTPSCPGGRVSSCAYTCSSGGGRGGRRWSSSAWNAATRIPQSGRGCGCARREGRPCFGRSSPSHTARRACASAASTSLSRLWAGRQASGQSLPQGATACSATAPGTRCASAARRAPRAPRAPPCSCAARPRSRGARARSRGTRRARASASPAWAPSA